MASTEFELKNSITVILNGIIDKYQKDANYRDRIGNPKGKRFPLLGLLNTFIY